MNTYILRRLPREEAPSEAATYGELFTEGGWKLCLTMEEPWRNNQTDVSCIPAGSYPTFIRRSYINGGDGKRKYDVPQLKNVRGREAVQIHIGNTLADTEGCILLGLQWNDAGGPEPYISDSKRAFRMFMAALLDETEFVLEVVDP